MDNRLPASRGRRTRAEIHFAAQERSARWREETDKASAATDARTAKLRQLRLEKEEADRLLSETAAASKKKPAPPE